MQITTIIIIVDLPVLIFEQFSNLFAQFAEVRPLVHVARPALLDDQVQVGVAVGWSLKPGGRKISNKRFGQIQLVKRTQDMDKVNSSKPN